MNAGPEGPAFVVLDGAAARAYRLSRGRTSVSYPSGYDIRLAAPIGGGTALDVRLAGDVGP